MAFRPTIAPWVCLERSEPLGPFTPGPPQGRTDREAPPPPPKTGQAATLEKNQKEIPARCFPFGLKFKSGDNGNSSLALLSFLPMLTEDGLANSGWGFSLPGLFFSFYLLQLK